MNLVSVVSQGKKAFVNGWSQADISPPLSCATSEITITSVKPLQNYDVLYVKETQTVRKLGVFSGLNLPKGYKIIYEAPAVSCVQWNKGRKSISSVWLKMSQVERDSLRSCFRKLRKVSDGRKGSLSDSDKRRLDRFISDYAFRDPQRERAHIYKLASHINHACRSCANAEHWVDSARPNEIAIKLVRSVKHGDEIFICYHKTVPYGCPLCPRKPTVSSKLRALIKSVPVDKEEPTTVPKTKAKSKPKTKAKTKLKTEPKKEPKTEPKTERKTAGCKLEAGADKVGVKLRWLRRLLNSNSNMVSSGSDQTLVDN